MQVRRVVTGHDADGKAVFVGDELVDPVTTALAPQSEFHQLWGFDRPPAFPDDGSQPAWASFFPPAGGFRFLFFCVPPDGTPVPEGVDVGAALAEYEAKLPGLLAHNEPDAPGMHKTATVDVEVVLSGEVWLELDDGAEVHLKPGDTVVQNGTRHAWRNHGTEVARLAAILVGTEHRDVATG